jgi:glycosyltransferase involved in cell wall biosynthesis
VLTADSTASIRIARIITRLNVGGPAIQAIEMSQRLEAIGFHTLLVHGSLGAGEADMSYLVPSDRRFEIAPVPALRREMAPLADVAALARLSGLLRRFRPHIVHTHMAKAGAVGRIAALIYNVSRASRATTARSARARLVHTYHGHVLDGYFSAATASAFTAAERALARRTDALVAVSTSVRRDLVERHRIGGDRFRVVPLGFDLSRLAAIGPADREAARRELAVAADARVASLVGRLTAIKRPDLFIEAADRVARADRRARFLVAGGGELEAAVRAAAAARGLSARISFLGWRRDVAPIYAASDVVVISSRNEGTPVALIEGMAAGVPGVSFAVGGVPDVIASPDLGVLVPDGDVEGLAAAVGQLFTDDRRRLDIGAHARRSALERFGVERLTRDLAALYRELLA